MRGRYSSFIAACPFEVSKEAFGEIFAKIDANGDGSVTSDEFVNYLIKAQLK